MTSNMNREKRILKSYWNTHKFNCFFLIWFECLAVINLALTVVSIVVIKNVPGLVAFNFTAFVLTTLGVIIEVHRYLKYREEWMESYL